MKRITVMTCTAAAIFFAACNSSDQKAEEATTAVREPKVSKHDPAFIGAMDNALNAYYELKDALVATDAEKAANGAAVLASTLDSLNFSALKNDSTGMIAATAADYAKTIGEEAKKISGLTDVEAMRTQFQIVSDAMFDLLRTVKYDNAVVYHQYCPMAFDDKGAYWLSNSDDIKNPYFGKKMLVCGEVRDSLDF